MTISKHAELEIIFGTPITEELRSVMSMKKPNDGFVLETSAGRWDVCETFTPEQIASVHALVHEILPKGAIALAEDWGGNFFCLMQDEATRGQIFWWSHEGAEIKFVAPSVVEFIRGLSERGA